MTHTLEDHQIQACSSDSSHQLLTQTLQMCHKPSISTWKPSTVPQMWSICSLSQWMVSILDPVIPPPALVMGHLADPVAPTSYSFGISLLLSATLCSVVHGQPISLVFGSTLTSWLIFCLHPLPHPTQEISLEFSLHKKGYPLLPKASQYLCNCSPMSNQLSTANKVLLHWPIPKSTLINWLLSSLTQQILMKDLLCARLYAHSGQK